MKKRLAHYQPRIYLLLMVLWVSPNALTASLNTYYIEPGTYGTKRESDPPDYVRNMANSDISGLNDKPWLDLGLDYRVRYEYRDDDIRRRASTSLDQPFLLRTRAYVGIKNILDPLRFVVELEDARRYNSEFPKDNRDVNELDAIQGYGELYFSDALGRDDRNNGRPVSLRLGRMALELLDRRLVGRNGWRNTTNNFDGIRLILGQEANDWQLELLALRPVTRLLDDLDKPNLDQRFFAAIGHWRTWSDIVTLEPYYMGLQQKGTQANNFRERDIHAVGIRAYGWISDSGFNYEISTTFQGGDDSGRDHRAEAFSGEIGYTWKDHPWRPRASLFYGVASGDKDPTDNKSQRFERFFGFARPWSANDYIVYENLRAPKLRLDFQPHQSVRISGGYGAFWLDSGRDRFNNLLDGSTANRDPDGDSGKFMGQEVDVSARLKLNDRCSLSLGYAHFRHGEFVHNRQLAANGATTGDSDFFYLEFSANLFK